MEASGKAPRRRAGCPPLRRAGRARTARAAKPPAGRRARDCRSGRAAQARSGRGRRLSRRENQSRSRMRSAHSGAGGSNPRSTLSALRVRIPRSRDDLTPHQRFRRILSPKTGVRLP
jgi:hypothetical protein